MRSIVQSFFSSMQSDFIAGRLEAVAERLANPLVIYSPAGVVVSQNPDDIMRRASRYREALFALSTESGAFEILSQGEVVNNRMRVTLRATYATASGFETASSVSRYFLLENEQSFLVEMIEYLEVPSSMENIVGPS
ncbi:MAG: hypothetical protein AAGF55_11260 [Pseudomonadota bacterium]